MKNVWLNPRFANNAPQLAIFADRDGTLIRHIDYIGDPAKIELLPGVKASVHTLIEQGIPFFILTNQSGVGRGYFPIAQVHACSAAYLNCSNCNLKTSPVGASHRKPLASQGAIASPRPALSMKPSAI